MSGRLKMRGLRALQMMVLTALMVGWVVVGPSPARAAATVPLDPTFGAGTEHSGYADVTSVLPAVPLADGDVLAVTTPFGPLTRLRPDGSPDLTFATAVTPGAVALPLTGAARSLTAAPNGEIVVGDGSTVVRVAADGSAVRDAVGGLRAIDFFDTIRILGFEPGGGLLVAAMLTNHSHVDVVARLAVDGSLDTSYAPGSAVAPGLAVVSGGFTVQ
ncbi:MAG: hypothetical protein ABIR68_01695, partial [Ilumatobacteraceae bacterium]